MTSNRGALAALVAVVFSPIASAQTHAPCSGDLDRDGDIDGADIGLLLLQWGPCDGIELATVTGEVAGPSGQEVAGATITTSTGQSTTTDEAGAFSLQVEVGESGDEVLLTFFTSAFDPPLVGVVRTSRLMPGDSMQLGRIDMVTYAVGCSNAEWSSLCVGMPDPDAYIAGLAVFDDGTGSALYAGGRFTSAGGAAATNLARWNGSAWQTPSNAAWTVNGRDPVSAMAVFDDGTGPALYVGTTYSDFQSGPLGYIVRWNGATWSGAPFNWNGGPVRGLFVHDDGSGNAIYAAGGREPYAAYVSVNHLTRHGGDGTTPFSNPLAVYPHNHYSARVHCFATFDDGGGTALYIAGKFPSAAGGGQYSIAKWDGQAWSGVGGGVPTGGSGCCPWGAINAMTVFDDGTGPALYVGGSFTAAGSTPALNVAKWDGKEWSAVGDGIPGSIHALAVFDDGSGDALYAGGALNIAGVGGVPLVRLEDGAWSPVEGTFDGPVNALLTVGQSQPPGTGLFIGGDFSLVDDSAANCVARRSCAP